MNKRLIMATRVMLVMTMAKMANAVPKYSLLDSWTGFYAGVDAGFVYDEVKLRSQQLGFTNPDETCNINSAFSMLFPGIQLGYTQQYPNHFVSGIEANVTFNSNPNHTLNCNCPTNSYVSDSFLFKNQKQGSIKGRGGRAIMWNKSIVLPYLTTGVSLVNTGLTYKNEGGDFYSQNTVQAGWLIGAGMEWPLSKRWSMRAEYDYVNYGTINNLQIPSVYGLIDPNGSARVNLNTNNFLIAINYWI